MQRRPQILGILNITEDSFSDGGKFLSREAALEHGRKLMADGADILDIGAAASNPDAKPVAPAEEIRRLQSVVPALLALGARLSIDSFQSQTQAWALDQFALAERQSPLPSGRGQGEGFCLNDIHGFADPALYPRLAAAPGVKLILMHAVQAQGVATREKGDPETIWDKILSFFSARLAALEAAGIARTRMILDPGMGLFLGAGREVSFKVLRELPRLKAAFGLPVLVSVSRKSFLRAGLGRSPAESGPATLAAELFAARRGADYIRTHEVRALKDALAVTAALEGSP